jgi:hypothetical protein
LSGCVFEGTLTLAVCVVTGLEAAVGGGRLSAVDSFIIAAELGDVGSILAVDLLPSTGFEPETFLTASEPAWVTWSLFSSCELFS